MPYASSSIYVTFRHTINATDEVAQTGLHISIPAGWSEALALDALPLFGARADDLATAWSSNIWGESLFRLGNYGRFVGVKVAALGLAGQYLTDAVELDVTPVAGGAADVAPQSSTVLSFRSGSSFGRANYGRMYVPYSQPALTGGSPYISGTNVPFLAAAAAGFLNDVNAIAESEVTGARVCILSPIGAGTTKVVTTVGVDNVLDTQRRRSRQLQHTYTFEALD